MSPKEYDYFFSVGEACPTAMMLKQMGLRSFSGPFDWVCGTSLKDRLSILSSNVPLFLDTDEWEYQGNRFEPEPRDIYINKRLGISYPHDFLYETPLEISLPIVKDRYERRLKRVLDVLNQNKKVLLVYMSANKNPSFDLNKIVETFKNFSMSFPATVHMLYIQNDPEMSGQDFKITSPADFFTFVECTYSNSDGKLDTELIKRIFADYHCTSEQSNKKWLARQKLKKKIKGWFINKRIKGDDFYYRIFGFKYRPKRSKIK